MFAERNNVKQIFDEIFIIQTTILFLKLSKLFWNHFSNNGNISIICGSREKENTGKG